MQRRTKSGGPNAGLHHLPIPVRFAVDVNALVVGPPAVGTRAQVQATMNGLHLRLQSQVNFALHLFFARYLRSLFTPSRPGGK
jgi:hypothetical protein